MNELKLLCKQVYREGKYFLEHYPIPQVLKWGVMRLWVSLFGNQIRFIPNKNLGIKTLKKEGFFELPLLSETYVNKLVNYFLACKSSEEGINYRSIVKYNDVWRAKNIVRPPGLLATNSEDCSLKQIACLPLFTDLASDFLALPKNKIFATASIDALLKIDGQRVKLSDYDDALEWHRDVDGYKFIKIFIYLSEVQVGYGHHELYLGSQNKIPLSLVSMRRKSQKEIELIFPADSLHQVIGPPGYTFAENTFALHRGTIPTNGDRLILSLEYFSDEFKWAKFAYLNPFSIVKGSKQ